MIKLLILKLNKFIFILAVFSATNYAIPDQSLSAEEIRALQEAKQGQSVIKEEEKFLEIQTSVKKDKEALNCDITECIYGYNLFSETPTTFALSSNTPVPDDYKIGPGDKIKVEYFGNNQDSSEGYVSRSGQIKLPLLGPISVAGLELSTAFDLIRKKVSEELIGTEVFISLSELRSINVYLLGAAFKPGTYTVSALASLTNVIFSTGGPDRIGSLRTIEVKRNGKLIKTYDFYKLALEGDTSQDIRLQDGDSIFYPLITDSVRINGDVQRPGRYEILKGDKVSDLYKFSGINSFEDVKIELSRYEPTEDRRNVSIFDKSFSQNLELLNGDSINVIASSNYEIANVYLSGEFLFPGIYALNPGETISKLIERAGGYTNDAYPEAAVFTRETIRIQQKESFVRTAETLERSIVDAISSGTMIDGEAYRVFNEFIVQLKDQDPIGRRVANVDPYSLRSDPRLDFTLQDGDALFVPQRSSSVSVVGEVLNSTTLQFDDDLGVKDYIELAGGYSDGADLSKIFIILPNGQSVTYKRKLFQNDISQSILPGSTIVVSRNPDPYNWTKLAAVISPILSDLAVSAAAISAVSNNN